MEEFVDSVDPSLDQLKARLAALGFEPPEANLRAMHAALPHLDRMRARLRGPGWEYGDEPAHLFTPAAAEEGGR